MQRLRVPGAAATERSEGSDCNGLEAATVRTRDAAATVRGVE